MIGLDVGLIKGTKPHVILANFSETLTKTFLPIGEKALAAS